MGWLEGVLSGYADRHYDIEKQKRDEAEQAADRQGRVFQALLQSDDPEIQAYAGAGILDLANPRRRKGGIAGWMGEIEQTPYLDMLRRAQQGSGPGEARGDTPPATPSVPTPAGSLPAPAAPSAALPATAATEGGPVTPVTPAPTTQAAPPPTPPPAGVDPRTWMYLTDTAKQSLGGQPGAAPGAPPSPTYPGSTPPPSLSGAGLSPTVSFAPPPPPPAPVGAGLPGGTTRVVGGAPPVPAQRTGLRNLFPTARDLTRQEAVARSAGTDQGEQESWIRVAAAQGAPDPRAAGLKLWAEAQVTARGGGGYSNQLTRIEYTDPVSGRVVRTPATYNKATGKFILPNGEVAPADMRIVTAGRLAQPLEAAAIQMGFPSASAVPQARFQEMLDRAEQIDAGLTENRKEAQLNVISPETAITNRLPVGIHADQLAGQTLPTPQDRTRRNSITVLRSEVELIKQLVPKALVSAQDLGGLAPNAANALHARTDKRNEFAELSNAVNAIVNTLARAVADQRGAQTEQDARRAEEALTAFSTSIKSVFTDPLGGDTVESAQRRLTQTLAFLDVVLAQIPQEPTIQPPGGAAAPATAAPGVVPPPAKPAPPAAAAAGGAPHFEWDAGKKSWVLR